MKFTFWNVAGIVALFLPTIALVVYMGARTEGIGTTKIGDITSNPTRIYFTIPKDFRLILGVNKSSPQTWKGDLTFRVGEAVVLKIPISPQSSMEGGPLQKADHLRTYQLTVAEVRGEMSDVASNLKQGDRCLVEIVWSQPPSEGSSLWVSWHGLAYHRPPTLNATLRE